jgi:threonine/homoserine/homoserine lactone efflux protein
VLYIGAGSRLSAAMARPRTRRWLDRAVGAIFIAIGLAIFVELLV